MKRPLAVVILLAALGAAEDPRPPAVRAWEEPGYAPIHAGMATSRPVQVGEAWQEVVFTGTASADDARAIVQINAGAEAGSLWVDGLTVQAADGSVLPLTTADLRLIDARAIGATRTAEGDGLRLDTPRRVEFAWDVQLCSPFLTLRKGETYTVRCRLRGSRPAWAVSAYLMRHDPLRFYAAAGERMLLSTAVLARAAADAREVSLPIVLPWPRPGEAFDAGEAIAAVRQVRAAVPDARLILRVGVEPPAWWRQAHPDELLRWSNGRTDSYASPASQTWLRNACANLIALVRAVEAVHGDAIAAWHPLAQCTGEWYAPDWRHPEWGDTDISPAGTAAFRAFLRARYRDDAGLAAAWGRPERIDAVAVPVDAARRAGPAGPFRDPAANRDLLDHAEFQQLAMAEALAQVCTALRTATARPVLAYYGYTMELAGVRDGAGHTGHLALGRLLAAGQGPDVFAGMVSYHGRGAGGGAGLMAPAESIRLHGRAWAVEDDSRTHRSQANAGFDRTADLAATRAAIAGQFATAIAHRSRTWLLDLYGEGWFHDPAVWSDLAGLAGAAGPILPGPAAAEVAVVVDERSWLAFKPGTALSAPLGDRLRGAVARMGRPAGWWLLDDLVAGRLPPARLTIIANAVWLDADRRARLRAELARRGGTVLWLYAPGWLDERGANPAAVAELTGIAVVARPWPERPEPRTTTITARAPWLAGAGRVLPWPAGTAPVLAPLAQDGSEILGTDQDGLPALAASRAAGYPSLLLTNPGPDAGLLAALADAAGAHAWCAPGTVLAAGDRIAATARRDAPPAPLAPPSGVGSAPLWPPADLPVPPAGTTIVRLTSTP